MTQRGRAEFTTKAFLHCAVFAESARAPGKTATVCRPSAPLLGSVTFALNGNASLPHYDTFGTDQSRRSATIRSPKMTAIGAQSASVGSTSVRSSATYSTPPTAAASA